MLRICQILLNRGLLSSGISSEDGIVGQLRVAVKARQTVASIREDVCSFLCKLACLWWGRSPPSAVTTSGVEALGGSGVDVFEEDTFNIYLNSLLAAPFQILKGSNTVPLSSFCGFWYILETIQLLQSLVCASLGCFYKRNSSIWEFGFLSWPVCSSLLIEADHSELHK